MSCVAAYSIESSRVKPHTRTGASTSRSGASARRRHSKRTWSLPLPVQPCATASAPCSRGGAHEVPRDDRPRQRGHERVLALVERVGPQRGQTYSSANSARASTTFASTAPAASARSRIVSQSSSAPWPTSTASATTSAPHSSPIHRTATEVSRPPEYARTTRFGRCSGSPPPLTSPAPEPGELGERRRSRPPAPLGAHDERCVSSPATVPSTSGSPARSSAEPIDVRRARRRAQHDEVGAVRHLDHELAHDPAEVVVGRGAPPWRARGSRTPSSRRGCGPSPRRAPRGRGSPSPGSRPRRRPRAARRAAPGSTPPAPRAAGRCGAGAAACRASPSRVRSSSKLREQRPDRVHAVRRLLPHDRLPARRCTSARDLLAPVGGQAVQEHAPGPRPPP